MSEKARYFVYERREMGILVLLSVLIAVFGFTLGVHMGKRVGGSKFVVGDERPSLETADDQIPNRQELDEQLRGAEGAADSVLTQNLKAEVNRTGIHLDTTRQIELPKKTIVEKRAQAPQAKEAKQDAEDQEMAALRRPLPEGKYTLQVGSYQSLTDAKEHVEALEALELQPFMRKVTLEKKGLWYRLYLGGYDDMGAAKHFGAQFKQKQYMDSFIVIQMPSR